jgi:hypothetical protein
MNKLSRGVSFGTPVSLIIWALIIWACLAFGSARSAELPVATTQGACPKLLDAWRKWCAQMGLPSDTGAES